MGTIVDITQHELYRVLKSEEADAKLKLRNQSAINLLEHRKNVPYVAVAGPKIKSSKFNLPEEQKEFDVSPKKYIQLVTGSYKPINVKEDKIENIRKHSDMLVSVAIEKEDNEIVQNEEILVPVTEEVSIEAPVVEKVKIADQEMIRDEMQTVVDANVFNKNENIIDVSEYVTKSNNETQLLKEIDEKIAVMEQNLAVKDEEIGKLSVEISEAEKREKAEIEKATEIEKRNNELNQQIATAYEQQLKIQALQRKEKESLLEEINKKVQDADNKIIQFNSKKNDIEKRIIEQSEINAREEEYLARKEAVLAAVLPQSNFSDIMIQDNLIQFPDMNDTEEKVKKIA